MSYDNGTDRSVSAATLRKARRAWRTARRSAAWSGGMVHGRSGLFRLAKQYENNLRHEDAGHDGDMLRKLHGLACNDGSENIDVLFFCADGKPWLENDGTQVQLHIDSEFAKDILYLIAITRCRTFRKAIEYTIRESIEMYKDQ